jgi:hypothetical protein
MVTAITTAIMTFGKQKTDKKDKKIIFIFLFHIFVVNKQH